MREKVKKTLSRFCIQYVVYLIFYKYYIVKLSLTFWMGGIILRRDVWKRTRNGIEDVHASHETYIPEEEKNGRNNNS